MTAPTSATSSTPARVPRRLSPQAGILNRPPEHLLLLGLKFIGSDPRATLEALREVARLELTSNLADLGDASLPPAETGELGFRDGYDRTHLTITVGISATGFDRLGVPVEDRPADLTPIPWSQLGDAPINTDSGDIILQVCANSAFIAEHVQRRFEHGLRDQMQLVWAHTGVQRYNSRQGNVARHEGRAWIGFHDGSSNLDPRHDEADRALTFVDPAAVASYPRTPPPGQPGPYGGGSTPIFPPDLREHPGQEPAWTKNGSYLVARVSVNTLDSWDAQPLQTQEAVVGRTKVAGISLDRVSEVGATLETEPAFASNQADERVAVDAHIRKANPRGPEDSARRIFRRGYPLYEGGDGGLRRGLIFLCFGRTISTQFEFITRAWLVNPDFPRPGAGVDRLRAFDSQVLAGGYYFVPPLRNANQPWSWYVPPAAS